VAHVYGFWRSKRRGDGKEKNGFRIIIAETRVACVIAIVWLGQKVGHEQEWAQRIIVIVAEPPELFRLKCASHRYTADTNSMHFKWNNLLVCRVSARCNHGSTGLKQVCLA
jgi:hypothetical protein